MPRNYYVSGGWNVICDSCGKKIKASEAKQRWDGLIVCPADFEMRQPQDFVKARADKITVPFTRPRPTDDFIYTQGLWDVVEPSDSDASMDYLVNNADYFLEDYMIDYTAFSIVMSWQREFEDAVDQLDDAISFALNTEAFADSVSMSDTATVVRRFVRTFNDTTTISEADAKSLLKALADATTAVDNFTRTVQYVRTLTDSVDTPTEVLAFATSTQLADTVLLSESFAIVQKQVEEILETVNVTDSGGSIFNADYIDATYFLGNNYVGSSYTF